MRWATENLQVRSAAYQAGYLVGLADAQHLYDSPEVPGVSWIGWFRVRDVAWEAVYCPWAQSEEQQGYADALAYIGEREGSALHITT